MSNFQWLLVGLAAGYLVSQHKPGPRFRKPRAGAQLNRRGAVRGAGATPLDQPTGSDSYQEVGAYNPLFGAGYPDYIGDNSNPRVVNGGFWK